jgi:EAL domain-containing protein (putative c-di-GMP-specific phosphodiesterase class I)
VRSTIELAHNLGLELVAEGVEDQETLELLAALGCDLAQGFHLARPMPADDLARLAAGDGFAARQAVNPDSITFRP